MTPSNPQKKMLQMKSVWLRLSSLGLRRLRQAYRTWRLQFRQPWFEELNLGIITPKTC